MDKLKDTYLEEIAEIPEKIAVHDEQAGIDAKGSNSISDDNPEGQGLIIDGGIPGKNIPGPGPAAVKQAASKGGLKNITEEFREKIKKSVPPEFDFSSIGRIDLKEAEKIANEEIIFLKEDDLIVGLEDFELIPLKDVPDSWKEDRTSLKTQNLSIPAKTIERREEKTAVDSSDTEDELIFEDFSAENESIVRQSQEKIPEEQSETKPVQSVQVEEPVLSVEISAESIVSTEEPDKPSLEEKSEIAISSRAVILEPSEEDRSENAEDETYIASENVIDTQISEAVKDDYIIEDEQLPQRYAELVKKSNVIFIDDGHISKEYDSSITAIDDPLTNRLSKIIEISKGRFRIIENENDLLQNGYTIEDYGVYHYIDDTSYEERFIKDTDFEYIDNSIKKEDFIQYIQEIDDYFYDADREGTSEIAEIMGLSKDESEAFDDILFGDYFKDIDIDTGIEFINPDLDFFNRIIPERKNLVYILDDPDSLKHEEKKSIEDDVSSEFAVIFEENVREIETLLGESVTTAVPADQQVLLTEQDYDAGETVVIEDITDKIIILEDKVNLEQFMETMPDKKEDLAKLLAYLDGLFEKLPEDAVRKFADSEYFDLYVKVMKEMGI